MVPLPFDPDEVWGAKPQHHVAGTVNDMRVRAVVERIEADGAGARAGNRNSVNAIVLGAAWRRGCGVEPGDKVTVVLTPEGPQRDDLAPDIASALASNVEAGAFFDSLAQFYRKAYLRWIDATKRDPGERAKRITEVVRLCGKGLKERPK